MTPSGLLLVPEGQMLTELAVLKLQNHSMLALVTERLLIYR